MAQPFMSDRNVTITTNPGYGSLRAESAQFDTDYFRTETDARAWADRHGGWIAQTSPGIWRSTRHARA